jgi:ADP-ribose pyrophosphatase YjhB (NUDIX family)
VTYRDVTLRQWLGRFLTPLVMVHFRLTRGMTFGVRGAVVDEAGRIFLVKHTYVPGWYLPGGGVDPGETAEEALARELREEGNIVLAGAPTLLGLYQNPEASPRDHVAFYRVDRFSQLAPRGPDREIAEAGFFALTDLPADATPGTRRRVAELQGLRLPDGVW